jgi:ABC-type transport system involved in multi-copper enzyme maturation permease subunit
MTLRLARAEWYKVVRRPAFYVLLAILAAGVAIFGYVTPFLFLRRAPGLDRGNYESMLTDLLPQQLAAASLTGLADWGAAVALVVGALVAGSEYGWRTLPTLLLHAPGRGAVVGAQLLVTGGVAAAFALVAILTAAASSVLLGLATAAPMTAPAVFEIAGAVATGALMLTMWLWVGVTLAHLARSPTTSVGVGLVYLLVVEGLVQAVPAAGSRLSSAGRWLPGVNSKALPGLFGELAVGGASRTGIDPPVALLVVAGHAMLFAAIAIGWFRRREPT